MTHLRILSFIFITLLFANGNVFAQDDFGNGAGPKKQPLSPIVLSFERNQIKIESSLDIDGYYQIQDKAGRTMLAGTVSVKAHHAEVIDVNSLPADTYCLLLYVDEKTLSYLFCIQDEE